MKFIKLFAFVSIATFSVLGIQAEEKTTEKALVKEGKKHLTIVVGTHHYTPNKSMPLLKAELERLGLEVAIINPGWNPERDKRGVEGLEALKETDLVIFFIRFLKLEDEQLNHIMEYVKSGKPVVGLRTSNHGFNYPKGHAKVNLNMDFGREVLGSPYLIHLQGSTELEVIESEKNHPILTGVTGTWTSPGTLYLSNLEEGVKPLVIGTGKSRRTGKVETPFGVHDLKAIMTDNVAWTWTNKFGGKTFYSSLGHIGDFQQPNSMRIIVNGIHWAVGAPIPSEETEVKTFTIKAKKKKPKR